MKTYIVTVTGRKSNRSGMAIVQASNKQQAKIAGQDIAIAAMKKENGYVPELAITITIELVK